MAVDEVRGNLRTIGFRSRDKGGRRTGREAKSLLLVSISTPISADDGEGATTVGDMSADADERRPMSESFIAAATAQVPLIGKATKRGRDAP
jgi:hypothetical protein